MTQSVLQSSITLSESAARRATLLPALCAMAFGAFLVFGVGFSSPEVLHNAAHDSRHALGFPCH